MGVSLFRSSGAISWSKLCLSLVAQHADGGRFFALPLLECERMQGNAAPHAPWGSSNISIPSSFGYKIAMHSCGVEVQKVHRAESASDVLTHAVSEGVLAEGLRRRDTACQGGSSFIRKSRWVWGHPPSHRDCWQVRWVQS